MSRLITAPGEDPEPDNIHMFGTPKERLDFYRREIESGASLSATMRADDGPTPDGPVPAQFPHPSVPSAPPTVVLSGHAPDARHHATVVTPQGAS